MGLHAGASKVTSSAATTPPPKSARRVVRGQATEIGGPWPDRPVVEAWAEEYIRFERRPVEQEKLRTEIRRRLGQLTAAPDQVLHATFLEVDRTSRAFTLKDPDSCRSGRARHRRQQAGWQSSTPRQLAPPAALHDETP
jgi:hypothetical protein